LLWGASPSTAWAQADAEQLYKAAQAAYQAGQFAEAAEQAERASKTDNRNPEVFLLLGKARYQLGQVDEAIAAWKQTLALAPQEPFAKRMLDALQGGQRDVDTRIALVETMIRERLDAAALRECGKLLADKAPLDAQRAKIMTLQAELNVRAGSYADAQKTLREIQSLYGEHVDEAQTMLLLGQAKLRGGGPAIGEGLELLKQVLKKFPQSPAAPTARLEWLRFDLQQAVTVDLTGTLSHWLRDHPNHPMKNEARRTLLDAYLTLALQEARPERKGDLRNADLLAVALGAEICRSTVQADERSAMIQRLLQHLGQQYAAAGDPAAALAGTRTLLEAPMPSKTRRVLLIARAGYQGAVVLESLDKLVASGRLPESVPVGLPGLADPDAANESAGPAVGAVSPEAVTAEAFSRQLSEAVNTYTLINTEFPAQPAWDEQVKLAGKLRAYTEKIVAAGPVRQLIATDAWTLGVVLPVVEADAEAAVTQQAIELADAVLAGYQGVENATVRKATLDVSRQLTAALEPNDPPWAGAMTRHAARLAAEAAVVFGENVKAGRSEQNAQLSDVQRELLATLAEFVAADNAHAPAALQQIGNHLTAWISAEHWAAAEEAYTTLADKLPAAQSRRAELAVVRLWVQQVTRGHQRLTAAGLTVPRQLDPTLEKALSRCYQLQGDLVPSSPELPEVRSIPDAVVRHYKTLEYYDVAEAAIRVEPKEPVALADEYAAFLLAQSADEHARRELVRTLTQYGADEELVLGPHFQAAIDRWQKFVTDRPQSTMVPQAVERIFAIAGTFQQQSAHLVAADVYANLSEFAAGVDVLKQSTPGSPSVVQRAAFARADALDARARKLLTEQTAERGADDPPPARLSEEFAAAIAAYQEFIGAHPKSHLVADALGKVMAVANRYAQIDAWDVADAVYADLLASELDIRRPERLKFARAVCQLGHAMPDHAREVLAALTTGGLRGTAEGLDSQMLAMHDFAFDGTAMGTLVPGDSRPSPYAPADAGGMAVGGMGIGGGGGAGEGPASAEPPPATPPAGAPAPVVTAAPPPPRREPPPEAQRDSELLAMIRRRESSRAAQVAQLREQITFNQPVMQQGEQPQGRGQQVPQQMATPVAVLSDAELARQEKAIAAAYDAFAAIRKDHPRTPSAEQSRGEILVMVGHWRELSQWERSAALAKRFLDDNPTDAQRPKLSLEIARDRLAWAAKPIQRKATKQEMLVEVSTRFDRARAELTKLVADFPKEKSYRQQAQWDVAKSFLTQARVVAAFSPTLARGQYVRTTRELRQVARQHPDHPQIGTIPQMLWEISTELDSRAFYDEAILVLNELTIHDPMHGLAQQAALQIAQTYHQKLKRPLKAAEAYQELNYARGGADQSLQDAIFQIGSELKTQKRYVEALHVLETFVDGFPRHAQAGQALTMVGQIHQTNEAWEDAIAAYRRVIDEFENGQFVQESKWAIAECTINLSQWREAMDAYRDYVKAYAEDAKVAEANRRIEVLKDLVRYQGLVDDDGQRKAFDAQHQIATIVRRQLSNPVKAIIEYRKVVAKWPTSHLADDALFEVGSTYLQLGETEKAREALQEVAQKYPDSLMADDALFLVGKSHEDEAVSLATVTREGTLEKNRELAQRKAYQEAQSGRRKQLDIRDQRIADLKKAGQDEAAEVEAASQAGLYGQFNAANTALVAQKAVQEVESQTAAQLADRQDKTNAALRKAVEAYTAASKVSGADKADEALLQMATIYDQQLKDSKAAMATWLEIVRQFNGTDVAEDASWRIAQAYERDGDYTKAVEAYKSFLRSYRGSEKAGAAQFAIAENYEHLGEWINAMDAYTNYTTNFPDGPQAAKAKQQITWIKTYWL